MRKATAAAIAAGTSLVCLAPGRSPAQTTGAGTLVVRGGTVVVGDGRVLTGATVVVRDGLIAAVGKGAEAPADARVVDVTGARIYPGLIDALTAEGAGRERRRHHDQLRGQLPEPGLPRRHAQPGRDLDREAVRGAIAGATSPARSSAPTARTGRP